MIERSRWSTHPVVAGIVGVFAGGLAIMLIEWAAHLALGTADPKSAAAITPAMFAAVLIAWVAGAAVAAAAATRWNGGRSSVPGRVAGLFLFGGAVLTMFSFPHPAWMIIAAVVLMPAAAWWASRPRAR